MGNRIGRPESAWRALAAYAAMVGGALAVAVPLIVLAWMRAL